MIDERRLSAAINFQTLLSPVGSRADSSTIARLLVVIDVISVRPYGANYSLIDSNITQ